MAQQITNLDYFCDVSWFAVLQTYPWSLNASNFLHLQLIFRWSVVFRQTAYAVSVNDVHGGAACKSGTYMRYEQIIALKVGSQWSWWLVENIVEHDHPLLQWLSLIVSKTVQLLHSHKVCIFQFYMHHPVLSVLHVNTPKHTLSLLVCFSIFL